LVFSRRPTLNQGVQRLAGTAAGVSPPQGLRGVGASASTVGSWRLASRLRLRRPLRVFMLSVACCVPVQHAGCLCNVMPARAAAAFTSCLIQVDSNCVGGCCAACRTCHTFTGLFSDSVGGRVLSAAARCVRASTCSPAVRVAFCGRSCRHLHACCCCYLGGPASWYACSLRADLH